MPDEQRNLGSSSRSQNHDAAQADSSARAARTDRITIDARGSAGTGKRTEPGTRTRQTSQIAGGGTAHRHVDNGMDGRSSGRGSNASSASKRPSVRGSSSTSGRPSVRNGASKSRTGARRTASASSKSTSSGQSRDNRHPARSDASRQPNNGMGKQTGNASANGTSSYLSNSYGYVGAKPGPPIIPVALGVAAVILVIAIILAVRSCAAGSNGSDSPTGDTAAVAPSTVHFVAVGDNLPEDQIGTWADAQSGTTSDGSYDYTGIYKNIKPYIESADLAYVKEETHCGGDEIGPRGYPSFNTTDAMADAIVDTGFDLVASASNHSYDWGSYGANDHSTELWKTKDVVFTGTASNEEDAAKIATIERNGITFALLDYTYGVNGYDQSDLPSYAVNFIDKDRIASDVAKAREQADVVLVAMHWGTENLTKADDTQLEYAQYLADLGVDVVLGSHPHVIGPMQWVEGTSGNKTLVAYSLGNFLSRHEAPSATNELEGMLSCDFVRDETGKVSVENVVWTPLVNYTDGETYSIYAVKDFSNDLAANNSVLGQLDDACAWLKQTSIDIVGSEFTFDA